MVIAVNLISRLMEYHCSFEPRAELFFDPRSELEDLLTTFASTPARSFLEIGTYKGFMSAAVALAFPDARIVTLDLPDSLRSRWNPLPTSQVGQAHRELGIAHRIEQRFMDSSELWRLAARGEVYDLVFVDADHSPDAVFSDLVLGADLLSCERAVIVAHDYTEALEPNRPVWTLGVQEAVDRFLTVRPFRKRRLSGLLLVLERQL